MSETNKKLKEGGHLWRPSIRKSMMLVSKLEREEE